MQTLESLKRQIEGAKELESIVRTMKAMSASNIGQYESAVNSLSEYYYSIALGLVAYLKDKYVFPILEMEKFKKYDENLICAIVFGSDQGFVGQFNDSLAKFVSQSLSQLSGKTEVWTVGTRIPLVLVDSGLNVTKNFALPNSINAISSLISSILINVEERHMNGTLNEIYIFHNHSEPETIYSQKKLRLLPLDEQWRQSLFTYHWPTMKKPEVIGKNGNTLQELLSEYLFVTLFKACAESLASENYSRLGAMQRAEKNIEDLLNEVNNTYHRLRQSSIDEELFDVISGFEALKDKL